MIEAALGLFFIGGYDGASVRMIMSRAEGEVGLFYYCFKKKDEVFDRVLDRFFAIMRKLLRALWRRGGGIPAAS